MGVLFEELDYQATPIGGLSLRRRRELALDIEVHEIKLGDEFLMSSLFTAAEIELARLGLAMSAGDGLDVLVGGLGLGYTAQAALAEPRVRTLVVIEALAAVIGWHERGLLPLGAVLTGDPRARLVHGDFFALATADGAGFDPGRPDRCFHVILVDIDHSPRALLHPSHAGFYTADGLRRLARHLHPGGVFALWSNDPPDNDFMTTLAQVFPTTDAHVVSFHNPLQNRVATNTVYVARLARTGD